MRQDLCVRWPTPRISSPPLPRRAFAPGGAAPGGRLLSCSSSWSPLLSFRGVLVSFACHYFRICVSVLSLRFQDFLWWFWCVLELCIGGSHWTVPFGWHLSSLFENSCFLSGFSLQHFSVLFSLQFGIWGSKLHIILLIGTTAGPLNGSAWAHIKPFSTVG